MSERRWTLAEIKAALGAEKYAGWSEDDWQHVLNRLAALPDSECFCGETSMRNCPVHQNTPEPEREPSEGEFDEDAAFEAGSPECSNNNNEMACFVSGARWQFERDRKEIERLTNALTEVCAQSESWEMCALQYREALQSIVSRSRSWLITRETGAFEKPVHDSYRKIAEDALKGEGGEK